ncbi:MAG: 50S ribosomal protein L18 [Thermodesulfobacteriota bacterium]
MIDANPKGEARVRRRKRVRKRVKGTPERPRLSVFRSLRHTYAQVIVDTTGQTLISASTLSKEIRGELTRTGNTEAAEKVGELIARKSIKRGIKTVVFDRDGYLYHGRVSALAKAARENGLIF